MGPQGGVGGPRKAGAVHVASFDASKLLGADKASQKTPKGGRMGARSPGELGPRALACALVERCGSLDYAWWHLGAGGSGRLTYMNWNSGLSQLGLDVEQVCGISAQEMFWRMSSYNGNVTPESWKEFFRPCYETPEAMDALAEAARQHEAQSRPNRRLPGSSKPRRSRGLGMRRSTSTSGALEDIAEEQTPSSSSQNQGRQPAAVGAERTPSSSSSHSRGPASPTSPKTSLLGNQALPTINEMAALEAKMSKEELAEFEAQAESEQQVLEEEIASLNLKGVEALAYALTAKLGSVKKAFQWFDMTQSGKVAAVEFDTGTRLLRLDMGRLTGVDKRSIWRSMDRHSNGVLKKSDWREFFKEALSKLPADIFKRLEQSDGGSLAERAKKRRKQAGDGEDPSGHGAGSAGAKGGGADGAGRSRGGDGGDGGSAAEGARKARVGWEPESEEECGGSGSKGRRANGIGGGLGELGDLTEEELSFRERVKEELSKLPPGESAEYPPEGSHGGLDARRLRIVQDVAEELALFTHVLDLGSSPPQPDMIRTTHYGKGSFSLDKEEEGALGILVFNLKDFADEVRAQLRGLPLGERLEFPAELTAEQRQVVHLVATALGLWTQSEGQGASRRVIAFNLGDLADEIRRKLEALQPGESIAFPPDFTEVQRKMVHMIASELQLWSYSAGEGAARHVEVFNLRQFAEEVREELSQLVPGEQRSYPSSLSEQHRKVVHFIAEELGLQHLSQGEGSERYVIVGNLHGFQAAVRVDLEGLEAGETKDYESSLSALQRKSVHVLAGELGMQSKSRGAGQDRHVSVTRPGGNDRMRQQKSLDEDGAESDQGEDETMTEESKIASLFDAFATGNYNGRKVFIGFRDLTAFAEELRDSMPTQHKRFRRLREDLGQVFEDTLQLQIDFGTRTKKGLTLQWFKVFIQKAARQVGMSVMGMLIAILGNAAAA